MELLIFVVFIVLGLGAYLIYLKKNEAYGTDKKYYYRRFLRNKVQTESFISQLELMVESHKCGNEKINKEQTVQNYLSSLKLDHKNTYAEATLKFLNRNKLRQKDKKVYAKILVDQSEKLYLVESNLTTLQAKYKN
jgi:hypothetical protein